mgnify:FL=1|tara:strand:- start:89 stop:943 length:855 start_codon:yes stop_codon:yes gene_type:complete
MLIYSCITNGYDEISDDHYYDPDVQYVMFTDGSVEHKGPWEFRPIPMENGCPRRLSAYVKTSPHKVFPVGTETVWIDGCYKMTEKFVEQSRKYLSENDFTVMRHPCVTEDGMTYLDECLEGFVCSMSTWDEVIDITTRLKETGKYSFRNYSAPVLGAIWRKITPTYYEFGDSWWEWSLIGPRRDQISFDAAKQFLRQEMKFIEEGWRHPGRWREAGEVGINFGTEGKRTRKKRHPQPGHLKQYMEREELLVELRRLTKLVPKLWAKNMHTQMIHRNVIEPEFPL